MLKNFLCLALLFCLLISCAPQTKITTPATNEADVLAKYLAQNPPHDPYRLQLSIRLGLKGDTRRGTAIVWGRDTQTVRLDVQAGVGAIIAQIFADPNNFLIVAPMDAKAYTHTGHNKPLLKIGVPLPLTLKNLADILLGNLPDVFGRNLTAANQKGDTIPFDLNDRLKGTIYLDGLGHVVRWDEKKGQGWVMDIAYGEDNLPAKISLANNVGQKAILVVRSRESSQDLNLAPLQLSIPPGFEVLPLAKYAAKNI